MSPRRRGGNRAAIGALLLTGVLAILALSDSRTLRKARDAFQQQDWRKAESECVAALRDHPDDAGAHKLLGMVYAAQQKFREAEAPFQRACELNPEDELACYYLGRNQFALSDYDRSRAVLQEALRAHPNSDRIKTGLGLTLEALGQVSDAERYLKQAAMTGNPEALSHYGQFLFRQGRVGESIAILERTANKEALQRALRQQATQPGSGSETATLSPVRFTAYELPMIVKNGATGDKHQIETMIAGVAVLDYDGDGWPDVYVANGATVPGLDKTNPSYWNRLFRNNHDGSFTDVTEKARVRGHGYSMGVAVGDYDNDGWPDLFVTGVRENTLYRNRGDGTFQDVTEKAGLKGDGTWSVAAGWFDYDRDGLLDLFVVRYVKWDPGTEQYCGDRRPGYRAYCHPRYYDPLPNALYRNQGDGTFRDVSAESGIGAFRGKGMGVAFADYDQDGYPDVFVANDTEPSFLFHNRENGKFEEVALRAGVGLNGDGRATSTMGVDFRDYDNDGWEDVFVTNLSNESFSLFRNLGRGKFAEVTQSARISGPSLLLGGWSTGMFDFDNNGYKDIFTANSHADDNIELTTSLESRQPNALFLSRGDGTFDRLLLPGKAYHRGAAFGDFNRDGKMDVVITRLNESPLVLMNATESDNHWLSVRMRGRRSNRDGIGARIHAVTDAGQQWNHVTTSVGYAGSSDRVVHFGLGASRSVRVLEVEWPSGTRQNVEHPGVDRVLDVEESEPPVRPYKR